MRKSISYSEYLKVQGLHYLAHKHHSKGDEYNEAICDILGAEDRYAGCVSDETMEDRPNLDRALENEGVKVRPQPKKKRGR